MRGKVNPAMGAVMVAVAAVMLRATSTSGSRPSSPATLPSALVNPTRGVEESSAVADDLASLRGSGHPASRQARRRQAEAGSSLPVLGRAPELHRPRHWFNIAADASRSPACAERSC